MAVGPEVSSIGSARCLCLEQFECSTCTYALNTIILALHMKYLKRRVFKHNLLRVFINEVNIFARFLKKLFQILVK